MFKSMISGRNSSGLPRSSVCSQVPLTFRLLASVGLTLLIHQNALASENHHNHAVETHHDAGHHDDADKESMTIHMGGGITLRPMISADSVIYSDNQKGRGDGYYSEALGIYNVHGHGGDAGGDDHAHNHNLEKGFNFRGVEAGLGIDIDNFAKGLILMHATEDHVELEEAWLATQNLPFGLTFKGGRFLSGFSTENQRHVHGQDFVTQNLAYRMLLNGEVRSDGVQASWSQKLFSNVSLHLGGELFNTENEALAGRVDAGDIANIESHPNSKMDPSLAQWKSEPDWPEVWTLYGRASFDIAPHNTITFGASFISSRLHQELHEYHPGINEANHGLEGTTKTLTLSADYKHRSGSPDGSGDFRIYGEYIYQEKPIGLTYHELKPVLVGQPRDLEVDAFYVAGLYNLSSDWKIGARYDQVGGLHKASRSRATVGPTHTSKFDDLWRVSGNVTWNINDHHQLRLEASHGEVQVPLDIDGDGRNEAIGKHVNAIMLQYVVKFGGHQH